MGEASLVLDGYLQYHVFPPVLFFPLNRYIDMQNPLLSCCSSNLHKFCLALVAGFIAALTGVLLTLLLKPNSVAAEKAQQTATQIAIPLARSSVGVASHFSNMGQIKSEGINSWTSGIMADVLSLATDPDNPNIIYAGTYGSGVYKSTNGGDTWSQVGLNYKDTGVYELTIDPRNSRIIYAGTDGSRGSCCLTKKGADLW